MRPLLYGAAGGSSSSASCSVGRLQRMRPRAQVPVVQIPASNAATAAVSGFLRRSAAATAGPAASAGVVATAAGGGCGGVACSALGASSRYCHRGGAAAAATATAYAWQQQQRQQQVSRYGRSLVAASAASSRRGVVRVASCSATARRGGLYYTAHSSNNDGVSNSSSNTIGRRQRQLRVLLLQQQQRRRRCTAMHTHVVHRGMVTSAYRRIDMTALTAPKTMVPQPSCRTVTAVVSCLPVSSADPASSGFAGGSRRRQGRGKGGRSPKSDSVAPALAPTAGGGGGTSPTSGPAPSAASSPVPAPNPPVEALSPGGSSGAKGSVATSASRRPSSSTSSSSSSAGVAVATRSLDGSDSDYEGPTSSPSNSNSSTVGGNIVPFARRQPRALVLDCAYRPINVLTWYKAFHFDYFGKGEVLEYYPPPAVCTTGSGDHPLPAVLRVPQYTADMQDLCSRVACTRRNIMVRDGFCCQYCGSRRDLTLDHVHPVSKGGKETWENLVTACMRCNQKKSDRTLRELGWKLKRQPKEPTPYEIGIVAGISTSDILRPPPEWEAYIASYRERLEMYRRAAVEAGLVNLIDDA